MARFDEGFGDFGSTSTIDDEIRRDHDREGVPVLIDEDEDTVRILVDSDDESEASEYERMEAALRLLDEHGAN